MAGPIGDSSDFVMIRLANGESSQDKSTVICNDSETIEGEVKRPSKLGKCRSRNNKVDCSPDYGGDADGDQHGQGIPSLREEKVSSLKTVSTPSCIAKFFCFVPVSVFLLLNKLLPALTNVVVVFVR